MNKKIILTTTLVSILLAGCATHNKTDTRITLAEEYKEKTFGYFIDNSYKDNKFVKKENKLSIKKNEMESSEEIFINTVNLAILETTNSNKIREVKEKQGISNISIIKEQQSPNKKIVNLKINVKVQKSINDKKNNDKIKHDKISLINKMKNDKEIIKLKKEIRLIESEQNKILLDKSNSEDKKNLRKVKEEIKILKLLLLENSSNIQKLDNNNKIEGNDQLNNNQIKGKNRLNNIKIKLETDLQKLKKKEENILNRSKIELNKIINNFKNELTIKKQEEIINNKKKNLMINDFKNNISKNDKDFEEMKIHILELEKKQNMLSSELLLVKNSTIENKKNIKKLTIEQNKLKKIYLDLTKQEVINFENELSSMDRKKTKIKNEKFILIQGKKIFLKEDDEIIEGLLLQILSQNRPLYFQLNEFNLDVEQYNLLAKLSKLMLKMDETRNFKIILEGNTDGSGSKILNKKLSLDRAKSVMNVLIKYGIPKNMIKANGLGSNNPVCSNKTLECYQLNRRTEIKIIEIKK